MDRSATRRILARRLLAMMGAAALGASCATPPEARRGVLVAGEDLLDRARQLTFAGRRAGEGYFRSDGRALVFQAEREPESPFYQIYRLDLADGAVVRVSPGPGKTTCGWFFPGGDAVLYASTEHDPTASEQQREELERRETGEARRYQWDFDPEYELYRIDLATGERRRLSRARGYDAEASVSPDGQWILFASNRHAYRDGAEPAGDPSAAMDLYRMRIDGSELERLTDAPGYDGGPFYSADGRSIVWRRFSPDGNAAEIYLMSLADREPRVLTALGALSWAPFFHPSGDYVIFATDLHGRGNFELYLVRTDGEGDPVRVTWRDGFDGLPAFSPDGEWLAWTSKRTGDGSSQLFRAAWSDAGARARLRLPARRPGAPPAPLSAERSARVAWLRERVERLTADDMDGRLTGTPGERLATEYVAASFESLGLEPAGAEGAYYQPFEFTAGVSLGDDNALAVEAGGGERDFAPDREWRPLAFSAGGEVEAAPVVFAGYGIVAPETEGVPAYDSYADADVEGRWVLVLRFVPEGASEAARQHWNRYASLRHKAMIARDRGARGLLVVVGPHAQARHSLVPLHLDGSPATTQLPALSIGSEIAEALLSPADRTLAALDAELDDGEPRAAFELPGVALRARVDLVREKNTGRNVLARLASGSGRPALVVGAHLDHLGRGGGNGSLALPDERGQIHRGADDNASGTAALLRVAADLAARHRNGALELARDVIFAAWSGEELGLLGSDHFVRGLAPDPHAAEPLRAKIAAYLNMDMVGRLGPRLTIQGVGSSHAWPVWIERAAAVEDLSVLAQDETYLPTDASSFYLQGVPFLSAFTGGHAEYHTPRDTSDLLDYEGLERVSDWVGALAAGLASDPEAPDYVAAPRPVAGAMRSGLRAYLGTIPDYVDTSLSGLRLAGVVEGGPAARAGLRAGDWIVELGGRRVENIYDYTYAIEAMKVGEEVGVGALRDGVRIELRVRPESRE